MSDEIEGGVGDNPRGGVSDELKVGARLCRFEGGCSIGGASVNGVGVDAGLDR